MKCSINVKEIQLIVFFSSSIFLLTTFRFLGLPLQIVTDLVA